MLVNKIFSAAALLSSAILFSSTANAHPGGNERLIKSTTVQQPAKEVWATMSNHDALDNCFLTKAQGPHSKVNVRKKNDERMELKCNIKVDGDKNVLNLHYGLEETSGKYKLKIKLSDKKNKTVIKWILVYERNGKPNILSEEKQELLENQKKSGNAMIDKSIDLINSAL